MTVASHSRPIVQRLIIALRRVERLDRSGTTYEPVKGAHFLAELQ